MVAKKLPASSFSCISPEISLSCPAPSHTFTWFSVMLIIAGWVVVHHLSVIRERQKEIRERKDKLIQTIYEIEKAAICFHQSGNFNEEAARLLLVSLLRISPEIKLLPFISKESKHFIELRRSVTYTNFDSSKFVSQQPTSKLVAKINQATDDLVTQIETDYSSRYLSGWSQSLRL